MHNEGINMRYYNDYGPMTTHSNWGYGGLIHTGVFLLLLVFVAIIAWRVMKHRGSFMVPHCEPLDIAKERYAKGEIDRDQFEQIKNDLK